MINRRNLIAAVVLFAGMLGLGNVNAQAVTGSLVTLINSGAYSYNRLERLSAIANQETYNQLASVCGNGTGGSCTGAQFQVFQNVRELVQSANELLGAGPTQFSLGVDFEGLGFALRWTAAEEMSAPGSASSQFANTQIASVMSRITALRFGATGGAFANNDTGALGGSAGDDGPGSRISMFADGGFAYGTRHPTELEDAFAFDGRNFTVGMDYRLSPQLVAGGMLELDHQRIEFDSSQSVVSGNMKANGFGLTVYGLYEWAGPYLDVALGWQRLDINTKRVINYPSFNINIDSVFATATGKTNSNNLIATLNFGWPIPIQAFGIDPDLRFDYRNSSIGAFREGSVYNAGSLVGLPAGYDFAFAKQSVSVADGSLGLKVRYTWRPSFGVVIPYLKGELHHNFDTSPFTVEADYNGGASNASQFDIPSEKRTATFAVYSAGVSMVLPHGWQMFAQYQAVSGIKYLSQHSITGGIRGEF
jgi:uncharacterized protein YhjY with autotransporter beta-barrel domain